MRKEMMRFSWLLQWSGLALLAVYWGRVLYVEVAKAAMGWGHQLQVKLFDNLPRMDIIVDTPFLKSANERLSLVGGCIENAASVGVVVKPLAIQETDDQINDNCHRAAHRLLGHPRLVFLVSHIPSSILFLLPFDNPGTATHQLFRVFANSITDCGCTQNLGCGC